MAEMKDNKKEPSFTYSTEKSVSKPITNNEKKSKFSDFFNFKNNQKKVAIAVIVSLLLIGLAYVLISVSTKEKSNVATLAENGIETVQPVKTEKKEIEKTDEETSKPSLWTRIKNWFTMPASDKKPSFDIARSKDGDLLITGRAKADTKVYILKDERDFAIETTDKNGEFVYIHKARLPEGNAKFSMYVTDEEGNKTFSEQDIIFSISYTQGKELAVLVGNNKPSKVLQAPANKYSSKFYLQNLDYDDDGEITFSGVAKTNAKLQIYVNNKLVASGYTKDKTEFVLSGEIDDFKEGEKYTVRVDMIMAEKDGKEIVCDRLTYKFAPSFFKGVGNSYIVKYGDNLWNISYSKYGKGSSYVVIFEGNKEQITNPDLIYPNQVFSVPNKDSEMYLDTRKKHYKE